MSRVIIKAFVIFLSLENIYQISALQTNTRDIRYVIFSLLFMIWWIWNLEILLISLIINLHKTELWETMLKTYAI